MDNQEDNHPLDILDNIEVVDEILSDSEMRLINNVFKDLNDFYIITDKIDFAISENIINEADVRTLYYSILKVVNSKDKTRNKKKRKDRHILRAFFELPEIIYEKISSNTRKILPI
jgi:hypothetical protein